MPNSPRPVADRYTDRTGSRETAAMVAKRKAQAAPPDDIFISQEEGWEILEENAQRLLGMSAEEFIRRWDSGELKVDRPRIMDVAALLPLVRDKF
jgi:hypothetical protein